MKARSKAQKLAVKRGRPKLTASIHTREPNGRLSRRRERKVELEHETISTVAATRMRHYGLTDITKAADPRHGYVLGRMFMDGTINEVQHDAGKRYAEDMARYYGLTGVPFPSARAQDLFAVRSTGGDEDDTRVERARKARERMTALRSRLQNCGDINTGRKVEQTVIAICVQDLDHLRKLNPVMLAWLKRGLNSLAMYYGVAS